MLYACPYPYCFVANHHGVCVPVIFQSDLTQDITTSVLWVDNKPHMITLDYTVQVPEGPQSSPELRYTYLYH